MLEAYAIGVEAHIGPALALFTAAFLQSITGFGLVIVGAPLLMLFYDAKLTVPVMLMLSCCGNMVQGYMARRKANYKLTLHLACGVVLGLPIGFFIFDSMNATQLKIFINVMILVSISLMQLLHVKIQMRTRNSLIAGFFCAITSVTAGMAGPPYLIYLARSSIPADVFRATCFVFFLACNASSLTSYLVGGHPIAPAAHEFIYLLPALALGIVCGNLVFSHMPRELIKRSIFLILYVTCSGSILYELLK